MLVRLLTQDYVSKEELITAASHDDREITIGSAKVFLSALRKKLARHHIQVITIPKLGYGVDKGAREKIHKLLAEHDTAIMSLPQSPVGPVEGAR